MPKLQFKLWAGRLSRVMEWTDIWSEDRTRYENPYVSPNGVILIKYLYKYPDHRARRDEIEEHMGEKEASDAISELKKLWMIQRTCSPVSDYDSFSLTGDGLAKAHKCFGDEIDDEFTG